MCAASVGMSFPCVRDKDLGRSTKLNDTSEGIEMGAAPTRDRAAEVVEKHCARGGEKAGVRKRGNERRWKGSRRTCRAQRWGRHDMVASVFDRSADLMILSE